MQTRNGWASGSVLRPVFDPDLEDEPQFKVWKIWKLCGCWHLLSLPRNTWSSQSDSKLCHTSQISRVCDTSQIMSDLFFFFFFEVDDQVECKMQMLERQNQDGQHGRTKNNSVPSFMFLVMF